MDNLFSLIEHEARIAKVNREAWQREPARPPIAVRRVLTEDEPTITEFLCRLSAESVRLRYLIPRSFTAATAQREAARMLRGRAGKTVTLVATTPVAEAATVVAVAELVPDANDTTIAAIALIVREDYQRRGLGRYLLNRLVRRARAVGVTTLRADLLAENRATRRLLDRLGLPISATTSHGEMTAIIALSADATPRP